MTSTIIRVKRRRNEDPSDVIILSAKKRKADNPDVLDDNIKVMKLAATIDSKDGPDKLSQTVNKILSKKNVPNFEELKQKYKKSITAKNSPLDQMKDATNSSRVENRFRLVAQKRSLKIEDLEEWPESDKACSETLKSGDQDQKIFSLYDVVSEEPTVNQLEKEPEKISCNGVEMIREYVSAQKDYSAESEYGYVYDVYYSQSNAEGALNQDFDDSLLDGLISIQPFNSGDNLLYDEYRDDPEEFKYEDDEDSNDEDNERNEYPDEDEESSYLGYCDDGDLDLEMGMKGMGFCSEDSQLSSDEEDQLLYTRSFDEDASHHGSAYAKYKQRMMKELYDDDEYDHDLDRSDDD